MKIATQRIIANKNGINKKKKHTHTHNQKAVPQADKPADQAAVP